jgi:hypothetical protein
MPCDDVVISSGMTVIYTVLIQQDIFMFVAVRTLDLSFTAPVVRGCKTQETQIKVKRKRDVQ